MAAAAILNFSKRNHVGAKHQNPDENIGPELYISSEKTPSPQNAKATRLLAGYRTKNKDKYFST